jgi:trans-L-3-hydroxyproline dehydratase
VLFRSRSVAFHNVPSFVLEPDLEVDVPGLGRVRCDIAFGGAFYAYVDARDVGLEVRASTHGLAIDIGMRIKRAVTAAYRIRHPTGADDLNFLYGTILVEPVGANGVHSRNVTIFAEGEIDRSPCGTGVCGRAAIHHLRGELRVGERITIESLIGTSFDVRVASETTVGDLAAVVPEVTGAAYITGRHEFLIDPEDPLAGGFILR